MGGASPRSGRRGPRPLIGPLCVCVSPLKIVKGSFVRDPEQAPGSARSCGPALGAGLSTLSPNLVN